MGTFFSFFWWIWWWLKVGNWKIHEILDGQSRENVVKMGGSSVSMLNNRRVGHKDGDRMRQWWIIVGFITRNVWDVSPDASKAKGYTSRNFTMNSLCMWGTPSTYKWFMIALLTLAHKYGDITERPSVIKGYSGLDGCFCGNITDKWVLFHCHVWVAGTWEIWVDNGKYKEDW